MRMKNRFCRMGKTLLGAMCLLSTCGVTYSCSDDFDLDETSPSFLGQSIYDELKKDPKFSTVIGLIDDVENGVYKEVLARTGSNTLFVADDDAYARFFASGVWLKPEGSKYRSYKELSQSQKKLLLKGSMLNNAYVLEMMTTIQGPIKNLCLRQLSSLTAVDTVPYFPKATLPENLNRGQLAEDGTITNADKRFWDRYRNSTTRQGIYMALDNTQPMMTHFLDGQLREKKITAEDVSFILGFDGTSKEWKTSDNIDRSFVYGSEIIKPDVTCMNGYYHVLDSVLVTPPNMAEVIRTNGDTKLFSAMLERFSMPMYDASLSLNFREPNTGLPVDSVFQKIYISQRSQRGQVSSDPDGEALGDYPSLNYDPGWNSYTVSNSTKEQDMAAMFVPCDDAMKEYFLRGGGAMLIQRYNPNTPNDEAHLLDNLYQIPLNIIQPLINNLMKESFNESVPSKYATIMNDAQDPMFSSSIGISSPEDFKAAVKKVLLANNGIVYVMKNVIGPAAYSSVMAPVLFNEGAQVVNTVLHADDKFTSTNTGSAPLRKFYSTYFLSMQSSFSFFVPLDAGLKDYGYVETMSYATQNSLNYRFWTFEPAQITNTTGKCLAVKSKGYFWTPSQPMVPSKDNQAGNAYQSDANGDVSTGYGLTKATMLTELIDQHIIVHDNDDLAGVQGSRNYYVSRSGAPVHIVSRPASGPIGMKLEGGMQIELNSDATPNNDFVAEVKSYNDMKATVETYGNGKTYFIDRPIQPALNTAYGVMEAHPEFTAFFELCQEASNYETLYEKLFRPASMKDADWTNEAKKYIIFSSRTDRPTHNAQRLVRFFNNYRYSIYIPNNDAIERAKQNGLKTLAEIQEYVDQHTDEHGEVVGDAKAIAQAQVTLYMNFLKYHFCDQSLFVDNCTVGNKDDLNSTGNYCLSACIDEEAGSYIPVNVFQSPGKIYVRDNTKQLHKVEEPYNLIARDYELPDVATKSYSYNSQSYVVLHSLGNDYMLFDSSLRSGLRSAYSSPAKARAFVNKFRIKK